MWGKSWPLCPSQELTVSVLIMLWLSRLDGVDPARWVKVFIWRKVGPARRVTLPYQKGDPAKRVTLLAEPTFCSHVNGLPSFVRKCMKSWLGQGSSGRWVTLLPGTTFLHINGALAIYFLQHYYNFKQGDEDNHNPLIFDFLFPLNRQMILIL